MREKKIKWHIIEMQYQLSIANRKHNAKKTFYFEKQIEVANRILKQNQ